MVLLVWAHPGAQSLTAALASSLEERLGALGREVQSVDLYRLTERGGFPCVLDEAGIRRKTSLDPLVQGQMALVEEAEGYAVVHPDWWGGPPALLKGWVDQVFRPGTAYEIPEGFGFRSAAGLLTGRRAAVLLCGDAAGPGPLESFWVDRVWGFCGVDTRLAYLSRTRERSRAERENFIRRETAAAEFLKKCPQPC